jgi:uncharacterized membrane protein
LIWLNFGHLFLVSLLPFATAWIARTRLASPPVAFYGGLFVGVDIAYNAFEREVLARADPTLLPEHSRRRARRRSLVVLAMFITATLIALVAPRLGFGLICGALILHLRPDVPGGPPKWSVHRKPNLVRLHKSMTMSRTGCEQQTRTLPSAG